MAHKIKTTKRPHTNKDGSQSKSKFDYIVTHRHRNKKMVIGTFPTAKAAAEAELEEKVKTFGPQE